MSEWIDGPPQSVTWDLHAAQIDHNRQVQARLESAETRLREAVDLAEEMWDWMDGSYPKPPPDHPWLVRLRAVATDPNSTEPMASGAAGENSQGTSDSEDKAVPGLATEGDE